MSEFALDSGVLHKNANDLAGKSFGRLTVIALSAERARDRGCKWLCRCGCGSMRLVRGASLLRGNSTSCGCRIKEVLRIRNKTILATHRHAAKKLRTQTYVCWDHMKARCLNPKTPAYPDYGGRGIQVCERWRNSFKNFLADMGERPEGKSLDRFPDNDGNYEPGNCRWATNEEQGRNTRANVRLTHQGETLTMIEWAERLGMKYQTLKARVSRGWPVEIALSAPVDIRYSRTNCPEDNEQESSDE